MASTPTENTPKARFRVLGHKQGLVDRVVEAIEAQILNGRLAISAKLPPEREFSERLGVSRTVVREAVRILVTKGLLETRHGIGTTVRAVNRGEVVKRLTLLLRTCEEPVSLDHLHQIRSILEGENACLAADQATDVEIQDLRRIVRELEPTANDLNLFAAKDAEFHHRLAQITHNPLLVSLLDSVHELYCAAFPQGGGPVGGLLAKFQTLVAPEHFERVMTAHIASLGHVAEHVAARNARGARAAMQEHLSLGLTIQAEMAGAGDKGKAEDRGVPGES